MTTEMEGIELGSGPKRKGLLRRGSWASDEYDSVSWQKEVLWAVVTEGVIGREELVERLEEGGAEDVDPVIEAMIESGLFEEINGYLRIHPNFAENCYAIIR